MSGTLDGYRKKWRVKLPVTLGGIAAALGIWYGLPNTPVQSLACEQVPAGWRVSERVCAAEFRALSSDDAELWIDRFLSRASGANPRNAFDLLTPSQQEDSPDFLANWAPVLFAERRGPVHKDIERGHNTFRYEYRAFSTSEGDPVSPRVGDVSTYQQLVRILRTVDGVEIDFVDPVDRIDALRVRFTRDRAAHDTKTFNSVSDRDVAAPLVGQGQALSLLCQIRLSTGWWSRTGWGWIAHTDLVGGEGPRPGEPICDPHFAE